MGYIILSCVLVVLSLVLYFSVRGYESRLAENKRELAGYKEKVYALEAYVARINAVYALNPADGVDAINKRLRDISEKYATAPATQQLPRGRHGKNSL